MTIALKGNAAMDRSFLDADVETVLTELSLNEKISLLAGEGWWEWVGCESPLTPEPYPFPGSTSPALRSLTARTVLAVGVSSK